MKKMIQKIREDREGFTLAELLVVVAIIAVLVAIAIPVFSAQLEKSRDAVSVANLRSAYAEASTSYLTGTSNNGVTVNGDTVTVSNVKFEGETSSDNYSGLAAELPFANAADLTEPAAGNHDVTFVFKADSNPTVTIK